MSIFWAIVLIAVLLACWALNLFGMPGNWLIVVATSIYVLFGTDATPLSIGWAVVILLVVLAAAGEIIELLAGLLGAAKVGASKRGALLALAGSVVGGVAGIFVGAPIPVAGPVVGALLLASLGALLGAMLGESWKGRGLEESWRIGKAAFWGRLFGTLGKILVGCVMIAVVAAALIL